MDNPQAWRAQLSHGQWFRQLPAQVQDSLLALARSRELAAGQCLFQRGDPPCGLYAVLEGAMRVGAVSRYLNGRFTSEVRYPRGSTLRIEVPPAATHR